MPRTLPFGELIRRRSIVLTRIRARADENRSQRKKEKSNQRFRKWSNRWHLKKYYLHTRSTFIVRDDLGGIPWKYERQGENPQSSFPYGGCSVEVLELCIQALCVEFDTIPLLLDIRLRDAPELKTKEILYVLWWLLKSKFCVSYSAIARCYGTSSKTVKRYTQDLQYFYLRHRDHEIASMLRRVSFLLVLLRANRVRRYWEIEEPVPRELARSNRKGHFDAFYRTLVRTAQVGKSRYQFSEISAPNQIDAEKRD